MQKGLTLSFKLEGWGADVSGRGRDSTPAPKRGPAGPASRRRAKSGVQGARGPKGEDPYGAARGAPTHPGAGALQGPG